MNLTLRSNQLKQTSEQGSKKDIATTYSRDRFPDSVAHGSDAQPRASRGQLSPSRSLFKWLA